MSKQEQLPSDQQFPQKGSSQSGTGFGYQVQARYMFHEPKEFGGIVLDNRWRTLYFQRSPIGVPTAGEFEWYLRPCQCMSYQAAQALRWWFVAAAEARDIAGSLCLETRLLKVKIKYSTESEVLEAIEEVDRHGR